MAFTDVTAELEELINKCEFENKQYVRAIKQENQLASSTEQETSVKKNETERLQVEMTQIDQQTKYYDRQFIHNRENLNNLKKTSDILTEHVHAMKCKFEDLKSKRDEEKCNQDQQLQHFRDVWTRYKEKYESFPLAIQLQKLRDKIQETEENTGMKLKETQTLKESTREVESANYWRSMDWNSFVIKLAENRVQSFRLKEEIMKSKKEIETLNAQKTLKVEMQACDENNVLKMSEMQINEVDEKDKNTNMTAMEICSPLISVLSEKDDEEGEVMQTDQHLDLPRKTDIQIMESITTETGVASTSKQDFSISLQPSTKVQEGIGQKIEPVVQDSSPYSPYVSYEKSSDYDHSVKESVDLHLDTLGNKRFIEIQNGLYTQKSYISQPVNQQYPQLSTSVPPVREISFINDKSQKNLSIQKSQLCKIPDEMAPLSRPQTSRSTFEIKAPTVSQSIDRRLDRSAPQRSYKRPSLSPSIQPQPPKITSSLNTSKNIIMPKISYTIPPLVKAKNGTTRTVPKFDSQRYARSSVSHLPSQQQFEQQGFPPNDMRSVKSTQAKPTNPEMLKVQTSRVLKSFTPQPSPCPGTSKQLSPQHQTDAAKQLRPELCFPESHDQAPAAKVSEEVSPTKTINMFSPGNVYYEPLKSSPEKKKALKSQSPHRSPAGKETSFNSPFNIDRHRQKLEELKKSPGYEQFQTESSSNNKPLMFGGGDNNIAQSPGKQPINTAVFGGAKQPTGDNLYTATPLISSAAEGTFSLFSFGDNPGEDDSGATFMMFGNGDSGRDKEAVSDRFGFNFGGKDTAMSPKNALSIFDNTAEGKSSNFCFDFRSGDSPGANEKENVLSLFGDSTADHNDNTSSTGFTFNFGYKNEGDSDMFSLFGSSDTESKEESTFSFKFS